MGTDGHRSETDILLGRMNIDQRIEKLAERQAALHRSVERLAEDQRKGSERRAAAFEASEAAMAKNQVLLSHTTASIDRAAARIAEARVQRHAGSEDRQQ
jgi:hypothetical protein